MLLEEVEMRQFVMAGGSNELPKGLGLKGDIVEAPMQNFDTPESVMGQFDFESKFPGFLW